MTGSSSDQFFLGHVPELGFAQQGRRSADRSEDFAVGRKGERLDPLGAADQPPDEFRTVRLMQQDLVKAGDRQQLLSGE